MTQDYPLVMYIRYQRDLVQALSIDYIKNIENVEEYKTFFKTYLEKYFIKVEVFLTSLSQTI